MASAYGDVTGGPIHVRPMPGRARQAAVVFMMRKQRRSSHGVDGAERDPKANNQVMRLTFLGTRGNIQARSRLHRMHSAVMVSSAGDRVLIDCGKDWLGRVRSLRSTAILISHAHDDHAAGLKGGAPCGVYASAQAWRGMAAWPLAMRYVVPARHPFALGGLLVEAWPVEHSLLAPAVGYRVTAGSTRIFYVPDVACLPNPIAALRDVNLFVGDGATLDRPLIRRRGALHIGHATIKTQLEWCAAAGVRNAVFTHCGSRIVRSAPCEVAVALTRTAREHGVRARFAHDGMRMTVLRADVQS
jgi:ribonuclease BN (tRNA processing enzyme)